MTSKYANLMLTIIAGCLVFQAVITAKQLANGAPLPVVLQGLNLGDAKMPVSIKDSAELDVTITGVAVPQRRTTRLMRGTKDTLPISIEEVNGQAFGIKPLPVEIR